MSTIKPTDRFTTTQPPFQASAELRDWLREEMERFALSGNASLEAIDIIRTVPSMFLAGQADDIILDIVDAKLVNYPAGGALGVVPIEPNFATGEITIPITGLYRTTAYVYGLQASGTQNESIRLLIDVSGARGIVASIDVTTNQTADRYLSVVLTREFQAGDVVSMWMNATGLLGLFEIQSTTLEMVFVTITDTQEAQSDGLTGMGWPP